MRLVGSEKLAELQQNSKNIRNICILAHVDHGKTTLADSLVASNGIISPKMAGKLRYMDSRKDEQERGITMKSSSIALFYCKEGGEYLINLIDSPGHVDFSSEVSTAVRLCDGAVVVVDVVEGVCPQTQVALKQAWLESIKPVLVLNKIDRLILEKKLSPLDAYVHLSQVLEQVNAVMGELFTTEVLGREVIFEKSSESMESDQTKRDISQWTSGLEEADDSQLYFCPDQGNVVFASAIDGWGFSIADFARLMAKKVGLEEDVLKQHLWGDYYFHSKSMKILPGAQEKAKKPLFVQFVLENLWAVYDTIVVRKDKEKLQKILDSIQIKLTTRDMRHTDGKVQLQAVFMQWLPLARAVLDMICSKLPSPIDINEEKVEKLMCSQTDRFDALPSESQALKSSFLQCSSDADAPIIIFISKMFPVERKLLPQNRPQPLSAVEIAQRRELARQRHAEKLMQQCTLEEPNRMQYMSKEDIESVATNQEQDMSSTDPNEDAFVAFARIFSGTLRKGQEVYVLGPKHDPLEALESMKKGEKINRDLKLKDLKSGQHITCVEVNEIYLLMGRELEAIDHVPAGNVFGIGGLEEHVLKTATLSTTVACPAFTEIAQLAVPIVRVAVEPCQPQDLPALIRGLRLLNQADACVQVIVQETGEHVLVTAGEVHLQRCLDDLKERYAKVSINASEPIVPFRETIVIPPVVDMVNEAIGEQNTALKKGDEEDCVEENHDGLITISTANKQSTIQIRAVPLPEKVTQLLENNLQLLQAMDRHFNVKFQKNLETCVIDSDPVVGPTVLTERTLKAISDLKTKLQEAFEDAGKSWENVVDKIWSLGPRRCGPNILLNEIPGYSPFSVWDAFNKDKVVDTRTEYNSSFINGFQLATLAGPLCEEPMMGVCFIIRNWTIANQPEVSGTAGSQPFGPFSGQIMSAVKEGCRRAFQAQPQRLMAAMYSCNIQVNAEVLGKMYAVLARRHGRVLHGDAVEGSASFSVTAVLPVVESFSFAPEIRKQTSGLASPQLVFSHWEVIEIDPFWTPATEEEYLHFGEKADSANRARKYMDAVRKRKGLAVEEKIVEFAEKQRTLKKKK